MIGGEGMTQSRRCPDLAARSPWRERNHPVWLAGAMARGAQDPQNQAFSRADAFCVTGWPTCLAEMHPLFR
jgi:hypothetical protein